MLAPRSEDHRSRLVNELNRDSKKPSKTHHGNEADIDCNEDCTLSSSGFRFDFSSLLPSSVDNPYGLVRRCNVVQKYASYWSRRKTTIFALDFANQQASSSPHPIPTTWKVSRGKQLPTKIIGRPHSLHVYVRNRRFPSPFDRPGALDI